MDINTIQSSNYHEKSASQVLHESLPVRVSRGSIKERTLKVGWVSNRRNFEGEGKYLLESG